MKHLATSTLLAGAVIGISATTAVAGAPGARPGDTTMPLVRTAPLTHHALKTGMRCKLKGTWSNIYGATITMKTNNKGTYVASYCGSPWNVKRTAHTKAGFTVELTYTGTDGCRDFSEDMTWNGCSEATGTYTDGSGGTTGPDTWTAADPHRVK